MKGSDSNTSSLRKIFIKNKFEKLGRIFYFFIFIFCRALAEELRVEPTGSRLGLVDGSSGQIMITPNFTDNSAKLQCEILAQPIRKLWKKKNIAIDIFSRVC